MVFLVQRPTLKSGRWNQIWPPGNVKNEENFARVDELIKSDRRVKIKEVAMKPDIPKSTAYEIVHDIIEKLIGSPRKCRKF